MSVAENPQLLVYINRGRLDRVSQILESSKGSLNSDGRTLLHVAAEAGHAQIVKYLLLKGANKEARDSSGNLPLQVAANEQVKQYLSKPNIAFAEDILEKAKSLLGDGKVKESLDTCQAALEKFSGLAEGHLYRGHALAGLGQLAEADEAYKMSISLDPTKPEPYWCRAQLAQTNMETFLERIDDLLQVFPNDKTATFNKAMAFMQLNRLKDSLPLWEWILEEDQMNAAAWGNKGLACFGLGDMVRAYACLSRCLEIAPGQQPFQQAFEDLEKTIRDKSFSLRQRAQEALAEAIVLQRSWRWEAAITLFDEVIRISPNDDRAWFGRGLSYARLRMEDEALICLTRALALNPQSAASTELRLIKKTQLIREREAAALFAKDQSGRMAEALSRIETAKKVAGIDVLEATREEIRQQRSQIRETRKQLQDRYSAALRVKFVFRKTTKAFRVGPNLLEELIDRFNITNSQTIVFKQEDVTDPDGFSVVPPEDLLSLENPRRLTKLFVTAQ